jgi:hypothetical protein
MGRAGGVLFSYHLTSSTLLVPRSWFHRPGAVLDRGKGSDRLIRNLVIAGFSHVEASHIASEA